MNLNELIERLEEIRDASPSYGELEVAMAVQPGYPLRETLRGVAGPEEELDYAEMLDDDEITKMTEGHAQTIWLVSGGQSSKYEANPYAPRWVLDAV